MTKNRALSTIMSISVVGVGFSGFLSYQELFRGQCNVSFIRCTTAFQAGIPACVIGLIMYLTVLIISFFGLRSKK